MQTRHVAHGANHCLVTFGYRHPPPPKQSKVSKYVITLERAKFVRPLRGSHAPLRSPIPNTKDPTPQYQRRKTQDQSPKIKRPLTNH
jgi:hypothetical protein